jgi:predicted RNase H-like HicB family nuclease
VPQDWNRDVNTDSSADDIASSSPELRRYEAVATQRGGWWIVEVPRLHGVLAHTSDPGGADALIREAIAIELDDADPSAFEVDVVFADESVTERRHADRPVTRPLVAPAEGDGRRASP